jgi:hypothetical protein
VDSAPPYLPKHSGAVLVCGSAECLFDDIERAKSIFGDIPVIAVNGAAKLVPAIALYSKHPERFIGRRWVEAQQRFFGKTTVHADTKATTRPACVNYWWSGIWGVGGSAWDARKLAVGLGFSKVILCGCPLIAGRHVGSLGFGSFMHREDIVEGFRRKIEADTDWHENAYSMSGFTKELLGEC